MRFFYHINIHKCEFNKPEKYDLDLVIKRSSVRPHELHKIVSFDPFFHPLTRRVYSWLNFIITIEYYKFLAYCCLIFVSCWEHAKWNAFLPYHIFHVFWVVCSLSLTFMQILNLGGKTTEILCEKAGRMWVDMQFSTYVTKPFLHNLLKSYPRMFQTVFWHKRYCRIEFNKERRKFQYNHCFASL